MLYATPAYLPFLVVALILYWLAVPAERRKHFLTLASLGFLGWLAWRGTLAMLVLVIPPLLRFLRASRGSSAR